MKKDLLDKYFSKEADSKEREEVLNWIKKNPENQKKYNLLKAQYVADTLKQDKDTNHEITFGAFITKQGKNRHSR